MRPPLLQNRNDEGEIIHQKSAAGYLSRVILSDLEGDGMTASNTFLKLYSCDDAEVISSTRENLLKYCHLNTLAMLKVLEVLQKV